MGIQFGLTLFPKRAFLLQQYPDQDFLLQTFWLQLDRIEILRCIVSGLLRSIENYLQQTVAASKKKL